MSCWKAPLTFGTVLVKRFQELGKDTAFPVLVQFLVNKMFSFCCGWPFPPGYFYCPPLPPRAIRLVPDERVMLAGQEVTEFCSISVNLSHASF